MACCHTEVPETGDGAFSVDTSAITFGAGCLNEAGDIAASLGIARIGLITDPTLVATEHVAIVLASLSAAGIDVAVFDEARVEPTDESFQAATKFASDADVDGFISVGGGSVIDTAKAANLYSTHPADFLTYVNTPIGAGEESAGPRSSLTSHAQQRRAQGANALVSLSSTSWRCERRLGSSRKRFGPRELSSIRTAHRRFHRMWWHRAPSTC